MTAKQPQRRKIKTDNGYRMLMAAIVHQAVKDGAAWFLESGTGKSYCDIAGINPVKFQGGGNYGTENKPGREIQRG
jgi:hypothetical protein